MASSPFREATMASRMVEDYSWQKQFARFLLLLLSFRQRIGNQSRFGRSSRVVCSSAEAEGISAWIRPVVYPVAISGSC